MTTTTKDELRRTPLRDEHRRLGAKMVGFAGWEMPVQYEGIVPEHRTVRTAVGLFDIGHMGIYTVTGAGATAFLDGLVPNSVANLAAGKALYTQFCRPDGGVIDDLIIYQVEPGAYYLVVNAGNRQKDWDWLQEHCPADVTLRDLDDELTFFALQGPATTKLTPALTQGDVTSLPSFGVMRADLCGHPAIWARTGYTGEDGFELFVPKAQAATIWQAILEAGEPFGIKPIGLGARDTLRLEVGLPLYGHELSETITPLEAGLGWTVKLAKGDFIGREVLAAQKETGPKRKLVGLKLLERGIPRQGYPIFDGDELVGEVVSGTLSPSLDAPIGTGFVAADRAVVGRALSLEIRGKRYPTEVVSLPFYRGSRIR